MGLLDASSGPLNLKEIFISYFSGTGEIFLVIALMIMAIWAAAFRMSASVYLSMVIVFLALMAGLSGQVPIFLIIILIVMGLVGPWLISKMIKT